MNVYVAMFSTKGYSPLQAQKRHFRVEIEQPETALNLGSEIQLQLFVSLEATVSLHF